MANTIIFLFCIILPSILFGYCVRWMLEEQTITNQIKANKQKEVLPPLD